MKRNIMVRCPKCNSEMGAGIGFHFCLDCGYNSPDRYWYKIWREYCDMCGRKVFECRERMYNKDEATKKITSVPVCEDCYGDMVL